MLVPSPSLDFLVLTINPLVIYSVIFCTQPDLTVSLIMQLYTFFCIFFELLLEKYVILGFFTRSSFMLLAS